MKEHKAESVSVIHPSAQDYTRRTVTVDFLFLNNESCDRCVGTEAALETAIKRIKPILRSLDVGITVRSIHVSTLEDAEATGLAVSPTIRINGHDIQPDYLQNTCEACGDLCACDGDVDCRLWKYDGEEYTTAPVELILKELVRAVAPDRASHYMTADEAYQVSSNVQTFFTGEDQRTDDSTDCGCSC